MLRQFTATLSLPADANQLVHFPHAAPPHPPWLHSRNTDSTLLRGYRNLATMLKGISPLISPDLLDALYRMGHGDEIVLADAHFPAESHGQRAIRADGLMIADLLEAVLPLLELDTFVDDPVAMMAPVEGDSADPQVESAYRAALDQLAPGTPPIAKLERFAFYERARNASAIVATGDTAKYGNLILKKGVTPA